MAAYASKTLPLAEPARRSEGQAAGAEKAPPVGRFIGIACREKDEQYG